MIRDLLCKRIYQICIIQYRQPYAQKIPDLTEVRDYSLESGMSY